MQTTKTSQHKQNTTIRAKNILCKFNELLPHHMQRGVLTLNPNLNLFDLKMAYVGQSTFVDIGELFLEYLVHTKAVQLF